MKPWTKFKASHQIYTTPFWLVQLIKELGRAFNEAVFNHPFNYIPIKEKDDEYAE